jgi:hypothetical protein
MIEYFADGRVKRVEFFTGWAPAAVTITVQENGSGA